MSNWKKCFLSDLITFGNGKTRPKSNGNFPVYGGNGILSYTNQTNYDGETIIIGRVGAYCGATYYEKGEIWVSDNALSAKAKNGIYPKFLYYFLLNLDLNQFAQGSSHPLLTQTLLNSIEVEVTSNILEQQAISEVLSALDDKIDLLQRQNQTLEQMAATLFRQWFIEEAKEDWEESNVGKVLSIKGGGTPSTKEPIYWNGDIAWTSPKDLSNQSSVFLLSTERKITSAGLAKISSGLLPKNTLLMSSRAPIGYLAITDIELAINQGYIAIMGNEKFSPEYMYLWCKINMELIKNAGNGSVFQEISKSSFKELPFIIPSEQVLNKFNNFIKYQFNKILLNTKQIQTLQTLRDTLLPKLISGEIRLKGFSEKIDGLQDAS